MLQKVFSSLATLIDRDNGVAGGDVVEVRCDELFDLGHYHSMEVGFLVFDNSVIQHVSFFVEHYLIGCSVKELKGQFAAVLVVDVCHSLFECFPRGLDVVGVATTCHGLYIELAKGMAS